MRKIGKANRFYLKEIVYNTGTVVILKTDPYIFTLCFVFCNNVLKRIIETTLKTQEYIWRVRCLHTTSSPVAWLLRCVLLVFIISHVENTWLCASWLAKSRYSRCDCWNMKSYWMMSDDVTFDRRVTCVGCDSVRRFMLLIFFTENGKNFSRSV